MASLRSRQLGRWFLLEEMKPPSPLAKPLGITVTEDFSGVPVSSPTFLALGFSFLEKMYGQVRKLITPLFHQSVACDPGTVPRLPYESKLSNTSVLTLDAFGE